MKMKWFRSSKKPAPPRAVPRGLQVARVSEYLSENAIRFFAGGASFPQALEALIRALGVPDADAVLQAVVSREEAGATILAPGAAVPHARVEGLSRIVAAVGICPGGLPHPSGESVRLLVVFLSPKEAMKDHLMFLAAVSALLQVEGLEASLLALDSPRAVLERLRGVEQA